jgi:hypothetical protein
MRNTECHGFLSLSSTARKFILIFTVVERAYGGVLRVRGRLQAGQPALREHAAGGAAGTLPQPCPTLQASQVRHPFY